jgi:hypothetical protein
MYGDRAPVPLNSDSISSSRLETRITESIACGPAFAHSKADCGATGRRENMPRGASERQQDAYRDYHHEAAKCERLKRFHTMSVASDSLGWLCSGFKHEFSGSDEKEPHLVLCVTLFASPLERTSHESRSDSIGRWVHALEHVCIRQYGAS